MKELVKTDKNGTKYYEEIVECWKCNGSGWYSWGPNGCYSGVCFACEGRGKRLIKSKEYTPEHEAKLMAQREKRRLKRAAEWEQQNAERQKEIDERNRKQAEREAEWQRQKALSNYVGEVGEKIELVVTVSFETEYEVPSFRGYGTRLVHIYSLKDDNGNTLVWKTGGYLRKESVDELGHIATFFAQKNDKVKIAATVKNHSDYKNEKQTELSRVKIVDIIDMDRTGEYHTKYDVKFWLGQEV